MIQKPSLVDDWKRCWRWLSVRCMSVAIGIQTTWAMVDSDMRATIDHRFVQVLTIGVLVLGLLGRIIKQDNKPSDDNC